MNFFKMFVSPLDSFFDVDWHLWDKGEGIFRQIVFSSFEGQDKAFPFLG